MENKFYEMHRSDAIQILLAKERSPHFHTNLELARLLEFYYPEKDRSYIVKEDSLSLSKPVITFKQF